MNQDRQNSQRRDAQNTEREQDFATYRTAQAQTIWPRRCFAVESTARFAAASNASCLSSWITALGVSVMCGLKAGCEDLCDSVDAYFDQHVHDINVQSTYGLTDDDLAAIQDRWCRDGRGHLYRDRLYRRGYDARACRRTEPLQENIDQPVLVRGELPETSGEVAADLTFFRGFGKKIGDTVSFAANDASSSNEKPRTSLPRAVTPLRPRFSTPPTRAPTRQSTPFVPPRLRTISSM